MAKETSDATNEINSEIPESRYNWTPGVLGLLYMAVSLFLGTIFHQIWLVVEISAPLMGLVFTFITAINHNKSRREKWIRFGFLIIGGVLGASIGYGLGLLVSS